MRHIRNSIHESNRSFKERKRTYMMDRRFRVCKKAKLQGRGKLDLKMPSSTIEKLGGGSRTTSPLSSPSTMNPISSLTSLYLSLSLLCFFSFRIYQKKQKYIYIYIKDGWTIKVQRWEKPTMKRTRGYGYGWRGWL